VTEIPQETSEARKWRRAERLRQVMVELEKEPAGLPWTELWKRVTAVCPLVDDDQVVLESGPLRGETDVRFYLSNLDKSGWVLTGGQYRLTRAGKKALRDYPDAEGLHAAAAEGYQAWDRLRRMNGETDQATLDGDESGLRPTRPGEPAMLAAGRTILDLGLRRGGSLFDPGRAVWSSATVERLREAFVEHPDSGKRSFVDKLRDQLTGAGDDAVLLAAEMLSLLLLPADDWKPDSKRTRIKEVLALMDEPVHIPLEISAAMDHGVFSGGLILKTLLWRSLTTFIEAASAWWRLDDAGREKAWKDPWAWRDLMDQLPPETTPSARSELCYLAHPEAFPLVILKDDRERIVKAYASELATPTGDLDRDLYAITMALQAQVGPGKVDYYRDPWVARWRPGSPAVTGRRAWLVRSTQSGALLLARWHEEECVSVQATHLPPVEAGIDTQAVRAAVDAGYQHVDYAQRLALANEYFDFLSRMKEDDIVATIANDNLYAGVVAGEAEYRPDGEPILRRAVSWQAKVPKSDLDAAVTSLLNRQGTVVDITAGFDALRALLPVEEDEVVDTGDKVEPSPPPPAPDVVPALPEVGTELAASLHMPQAPLQEIVDLLQTRQQIVLYGPPGTGKTYLAKKLAEYLVGDDPSRAQLVQFHPSYAYEDFFEGYRPVSEGGQATFELKPGPLRLIAGEAAENREAPFILIIDEMNRANLAKVFGELYFLLEYRDESMRLQYQPTEAFKLPKNLFIIGTMNTADRSIALVDAAIRRRFAFVELHPDTDPVKGVLTSFLAANGYDGERADLLAALNAEIEDQDRDLRIGPSYLMKADAATPGGLERIWKYEILPLLEEHYYGRLTRDEVHAKFGLETLRASLTPPTE
jgi:5-methylcytosine-specific restriction protein B